VTTPLQRLQDLGVTPPWEACSKHFTQKFVAFAATLMREMPVK
jgi:hypothetical protein